MRLTDPAKGQLSKVQDIIQQLGLMVSSYEGNLLPSAMTPIMDEAAELSTEIMMDFLDNVDIEEKMSRLNSLLNRAKALL